MTAIEPSGLCVSASHAVVKCDHAILPGRRVAQYCRRMALVFAQTGKSDETLKELTETIFHSSVGQRPGFIEDTLRTGHEKSSLRPELGTKRPQTAVGMPSRLRGRRCTEECREWS